MVKSSNFSKKKHIVNTEAKKETEIRELKLPVPQSRRERERKSRAREEFKEREKERERGGDWSVCDQRKVDQTMSSVWLGRRRLTLCFFFFFNVFVLFMYILII